MAQVTFRFNSSNVTKTIDKFKQKFPTAIVRALNRAATSARAGLASDVASDMKLKVGVVKEELRVQEATASRFSARVHASAKRIPLIEFKARGPYPSRGRGTVRALGKSYPNAFIAVVGAGGHQGVFTRKGASTSKSRGAWSPNLPIVELKEASIWHVATKHLPAAVARGEESLRKNLQSELRFAASVEAT